MLFRVFTVAVISLSFAVLANGQSKVGYIDSNIFLDEKAGITKFITELKALNTEFQPIRTEIDGMNARLQTLSKEIDDLRKIAASAPVDQKAAQAKVEQAEKLQRDIKFKSEDAQARYQRSQQTRLGPVQDSIMKGLQDFAKQRGYTLIFDIAKDQNGLLIAVGDQSADVTKEFITFFNAKP